MTDVLLPRAASLPATRTQAAFILCAVTLLSSIFLQKIALPGTGGQHPLNLVIFPATTLAAFLLGVIEVNTPALLFYSLVVLAGGISAAMSPSGQMSLLSLGYFLAVQFPLIFRLTALEFSYQRLLKFLAAIGCIFALLGVA